MPGIRGPAAARRYRAQKSRATSAMDRFGLRIPQPVADRASGGCPCPWLPVRRIRPIVMTGGSRRNVVEQPSPDLAWCTPKQPGVDLGHSKLRSATGESVRVAPRSFASPGRGTARSDGLPAITGANVDGPGRACAGHPNGRCRQARHRRCGSSGCPLWPPPSVHGALFRYGPAHRRNSY